MSVKKIFIILAGIIIATVIVGGIFILRQFKDTKSLLVSLIVDSPVSLGKPFELEVNVSNESQNILKDTELIIELPDDIVFLGSSSEKKIDSKIIGNLGAGGLSQETFKLLALAGESTIKKIKATVSYLPESLGSRFEVSRDIDFSVVGSSIDLDLSMPQKVFSGEEFETTITYKNISDTDFEDLRLKINYPPLFKFKSASLEPEFGNNFWELGDLRSNSAGKITIKGELLGQDDSFFEFRSTLETNLLGRSYTIAEKTASVAIAPSPLSITIELNDGQDFIAHLNDDLRYALTFTNNTDVALKDVIIKAKIIGQMFDLPSLNTAAAFRSVDNTLVWNFSNTPELGVIPAGQIGEVHFNFKVKDSYPIARLSDKNFTLKVEAEIESPTVPHSVASARTIGVAKIETKVGGQIKIEAQGFFRDAASGILNKGPWPLKVGERTNLTIHWLVSNYGTDVRDAEIKAFLGPNVRLTGVIKGNTNSEPSYNERTQEIVWKLDSIPATKGILTAPLETIFQIEVTPSITDLGSPVTLIKDTSMKGTDQFTLEILKAEHDEVTSNTLADPTVAGQGAVTP